MVVGFSLSLHSVDLSKDALRLFFLTANGLYTQCQKNDTHSIITYIQP